MSNQLNDQIISEVISTGETSILEFKTTFNNSAIATIVVC